MSAEKARRNLRLNPGATHPTIVEAAIGDSDSDVWLVRHGGRAMQNRICFDPPTELDATSVEQTTIDTWCERNHLYPDLIKVDVEGVEAAALRGMRRVIEAHRPMLFIEVHPNEIAASGDALDEELTFLLQRGYIISSCDKDTGCLSPLSVPSAPKSGNPVLVCRARV